MLVTVAIVTALVIAGVSFARAFNAFSFAGFPFGFYLLLQGLPIVLVAVLFWFVSRQDAIERDHGVSEDD
jgi:putative solute:sodium symporter small subunit